ncbi:hypothetical protein [Paenibacillus apiarius]|uniref:hypothetical protein n=1 Tax=Paenibacillus apiarius TaxID=46240 RepID=UPI0019819AAC|nr:hypothetical protein [Paenibacillus apiarius]MBN3527176.1 hypothetical protein [Paenibacillus apiarius]
MKSYKKRIAALAVSSMMFASMGPVWTVAEAAPASKETKEQKEKTIDDLDANLLKTAQITMRQLVGKDIELGSVSEYKGTWFIYLKEGKEKGQVVIEEKTGKVSSASLEMSFEELNAAMQKQALDALALFTKKGQPTVEVEVSLNKKLSMMGITPANGGMN